MSSVDLHPEDVLDRARRGAASPAELQRLRAHLAECPACRFEQVLADDARAAQMGTSGTPEATRADDTLLLARVRRGAARAVHRRGASGPTRVSRGRRRSPRLAYAVALLFVFAATVAAATTVVRRVWRGPEIVAVAPPATYATNATTTRSHRHVAPPAVEVPVVPTAAPESDAPVAPEAVAPVHAARPRLVAAAESPGDLFARANTARRRGETREAARLYRDLQREFPGSSEELVSRVTLGRWMLDRLNDPAGALGRFDSYLANPVHTALREEALIGRALALGRLGRQTEEGAAWTAFLAAFPGSVYAERARERLATLRLATPR